MQLTQEQQNIIWAVKNGESFIKINAFAGTGKTTTLLAIADEFKYKKILYLAFNKSIQLEASQKFPKNVIVKTTHSLAYGNVVKNNYENNSLRGEYKPKEIADIFYTDYDTARLTLKIFNNYCNSASKTISLENIKDENKNNTLRAKEYALELFNKMLNKEIPITHSFYLKYFQIMLLENKINIYPYDIIMLDEAQDTNDVTLSIFYNLPAKQKVIVGDRHQQIYSFRGSVNAMQKIRASIYFLTQSFRFNNNIAKRATNFLKLFKGEKNQLKGINRKISVISNSAHITRTNSTLIGIIADLIEEEKFFKTVREPYSIFGLALNILKILDEDELEQGFKYLESLHKDFSNQDKEDNFLLFLQDAAIEMEDKELYFAAKVVAKYRNNIKFFYKVAKENFNKNRECNTFLTTAHTSKGLEFDRVIVYNDFATIDAIAAFFAEAGVMPDDKTDYLKLFLEELQNNRVDQKYIDELNLYYVAITRAKYEVVDKTLLFERLKNVKKDEINSEIRFLIKQFIEKEIG